MWVIDREIDVNLPYVVKSDDTTVRPVYHDVKKTMYIPFVPNISKALAHQPEMMQAKWGSYSSRCQMVRNPG